MKILFVTRQLTALCGIGRPALELARVLKRKGHEIEILTDSISGQSFERHKQWVEKFELNTVPVSRIDGNLSWCLFSRDKDVTSLIQRKISNVDIVHSYDLMTSLSLLYSNISLRSPLLLNCSGPFQIKIRDIMKVKDSLPFLMRNWSVWVRLVIPGLFLTGALRGISHFMANCEFTAQALKEMKIPNNKISILPLCMDMGRFPDVDTKPWPDDPSFLFFGWASPIRGVPEVIEAFKMVKMEIPKAKMTMAFTGLHSEEEKMRQIINFAKVPDIEVHGLIVNVVDFIRRFTAVVLPFRVPIGYPQPPLTVLEAMMAGVPVISTNIGILPEEIHDGRTGYLIDPMDLDILKRRMIDVCRGDTAIKFGRAANEIVAKRHDVARLADKVEEIYEQQLN